MKQTETMLICVRHNIFEDKMEHFLHKEHEEWRLSDGEFSIGKTLVEYNLPDLVDSELRKKAIETLKVKQKRVMAEAEQTKMLLEKQIETLLCITHVSPDVPPCPPPKSNNVFDYDDIPF